MRLVTVQKSSGEYMNPPSTLRASEPTRTAAIGLVSEHDGSAAIEPDASLDAKWFNPVDANTGAAGEPAKVTSWPLLWIWLGLGASGLWISAIVWFFGRFFSTW
jgi:hypothetical protein